MITPFSPKNKYFIRFSYNKPIEGIGSASSFGVMSLDGLEENAQYQDRKKRGSGTVTIIENKKDYPEFHWVVISRKKF